MLLKNALRTVKESISETDSDACTTQDAFLLIALAALKQLQVAATANEDCAAAARQARKSLKTFLYNSPADTKASKGVKRVRVDAEELDIGQYAGSGAFADDEAKKNKFARLLGGGKADHAKAAHNTHAVSSSTLNRITKDLTNQFDSAMQHKGKKGLGA